MRSLTKSNRQPQRLGAVAIYMVLTFPLLIWMIVFGVDYGTISVARQHLQIAADMGAVSTLRVLMSDQDNADAAALESIGNNLLFGQPVAADLLDDVEYGTWNADTETFIVIPRVDGGPPSGATAVRISLERTRDEDNGIALFIAPIVGRDFADVRVVAIASATGGACSGFIGIESAALENNITTNSYDSTVGPYDSASRLDNGDVCSGGPVTLASGADIVGDAMGSSVTISQGSGATVSGTQTESPAVLDFPPVDFSDAASFNDNSMIERGPLWAPEFYNSSTGDLIVNNGRSIRLTEGTYHFRDLLLAGGSTLNIDGEVHIFIEREMRFDNGTVANLSQVPSNLQLFIGTGPVNVQGGHQLHASIYAPDADVRIANGSGFFGAIIGKTLWAAGGAGLFYDESLALEPSAGGGGGRARLVQ